MFPVGIKNGWYSGSVSTKGHIHRVKHGTGFKYLDSQGERVADPKTLEYLESLVIPPAWNEVEISPYPGSKILATGYDAAGRKQYIYNPKFREEREKAKFDRILAFANTLPMMRKITAQHLADRKLDRQKVLACMVRLIDLAYFRVGNEKYEKENHTYGLTTLRHRHLHLEGSHLIFHFVGKSHKEQTRDIADRKLAAVIAELDELPGYRIFKYYTEDGDLHEVNSEDLNAYIKEIMGYDFSAKDFRTWAGTLIAAVALAELGVADTDSGAKRNVTQAVKTVAEKLGNTPAIAKASYIDPRIIHHYLDGETISSYLSRIDYLLTLPEHELLGEAEVAVLKLLKRKLEPKTAKT